jgi:L-ribulose-5-phosphate 3-epimerase
MASETGRVISCITRPDRFGTVAAAGIKHVEVALPSPDQAPALKADAAAHGLAISSVQVRLDLQRETDLAEIDRSFQTVRDLGAAIVFTSVHADDADLETAYRRLRQIGDVAARHGLTVALETHPNLVSSGEVARRTMESVAHPSIRVNYDTANVHYYNHGVDSVAELRKALPHVAAVHLKDSKGLYESFDFPPVGQGIVDFPAIFRLLDEAGFKGPATLEIEFLRHPDPEVEFTRVLRESVAYLRKIGELA